LALATVAFVILGFRSLGSEVNSAILLTPPDRAAKTNVSPGRLTVGVLSFADETGDPEAAHWRFYVPGDVRASLECIQALRVRSEEATDFALRQLQLKHGIGPGTGMPEQRFCSLAGAAAAH
jgi:hypothetical protein